MKTLADPSPEEIVGEIILPLKIDGEEVKFHLFYFSFNQDRWIAALLGKPSDEQYFPLRIESACVFGHVFHSSQCDCGFQLDEAFARIKKVGKGVVIYAIDHDARGLGILSHFKIYHYRQKEQLDTEEVYERLGKPLDSRDYSPVSFILRYLKIENILLMSNNPSRRKFLLDHGFNVKNELIEADLTNFNMATLMLEKEDLGYNWSFKTHLEWLTPIQNKVESDWDLSAGIIVKANEEIIAQYESKDWDIAEGLAEKIKYSENIVVYLTDLPRVDELSTYAKMGLFFIVVPFPVIPSWLQERAKEYNLFVQDWGRKNKYKEVRPQWNLIFESEKISAYQRKHQLRYCLKDKNLKDHFINAFYEIGKLAPVNNFSFETVTEKQVSQSENDDFVSWKITKTLFGDIPILKY